MASESATGLLSGVFVVDATRALSGPYCTRILRDLGARVVKVEPKGQGAGSGDTLRYAAPRLRSGESSTRSTYFAFVNSGKESVCLDFREEGTADRATFDALLARADVLVENFRPGVMGRMGYSAAALRRRFPRLVVATISGFGQDGPYAQRAAYDAVVQSQSGIMSVTGMSEAEPVLAGVAVSDMVAGMYAAVGIAAALRRRHVDGMGRSVDVSMLDASVSLMGIQLAEYHISGVPPVPMGNASMVVAPADVFLCADGKRICVYAQKNTWFAALCRIIGRGDLVSDPRFRTNALRVRAPAALHGELAAAFRARPRDAWLPLLLSEGMPVGPVCSVDEVAADPQLRLRNMIVPTADGRHLLPGNPIKVAGVPDPGGAGEGLLAGVLVVDVTRALAGPYCTRILRQLGARVVKVEPKAGGDATGPGSGDGVRGLTPLLRSGEVSTRSGYFAFINSGKESVCLDFRKEGTPDRATFDALLERADVLVDNFRPGVMGRMGYGAAALRQRFPRLVTASVTGFGAEGPYASRGALDAVIQAMSGIVSVTGASPARLVRAGPFVSDMVAGIYTAIGVAAALARRGVDGRGRALDVAMLDASVAMMGVPLAEYHVNGKLPPPVGTVASTAVFPADVFQCAGGGRLCVYGTGGWWPALCRIVARDDLARDPRFATNGLRKKNQQALRSELTTAFRARPRDAWLPLLLKEGMPAGPVNSMADVAADPQLRFRNMLVRTADGRHLVPGNPIKVAGIPDRAVCPPPPALNADAGGLRADLAGAAAAKL